MKLLRTEEEINELIKGSEISILYFTGLACGACEVIKGKVEKLLEGFPKIKSGEINGEKNQAIAAKYDVFSLPICLLFVEGKESLRIGKNVDLMSLENKIRRYYEMIF